MNRLVSNFLELTSIDSPTGFEEKISDFLLKYFQNKKIEVIQDVAKNIFVKVPGKGEPLFLSAHIDTVEPGRGVLPVIEGDFIRSDGKTILGADNKSTIAVILELIEKIYEEEVAHRPLEILFTVDEESKSKGAIKFDYSLLKAKKGIISDIAEPIGTIVLASPAYASFDARLVGVSGHAAYPEKALNVLDALSEMLRMRKGRLDEDTTLNIGLVSSGTARNTIPGEAIIKGEIRSYKQDLLEKHMKDTEEFIKAVAERNSIKAELEIKKENPGYIFDQKDSHIEYIANSLKECGVFPKFIKSSSVSDANEFNNRGLQVVNIGDGTEKTHTVEERIKISDMEKLLDIFIHIASDTSDEKV